METQPAPTPKKDDADVDEADSKANGAAA